MIRINLLTERKAKRRRGGATDKGEQSLLLGFLILLGLGAAVYFLVHRPIQGEIEDQKAVNQRLSQQNDKIEKKTKDFEKRKSAYEAAQKQAAAIEQLNAARATPAWFLWELSNILTPNGQPTITPEMEQRLEANENLRWQEGWDPKHVWIRSLEEKDGRFTLRGAAQSDGDVTQLTHRLQASMFFEDVRPRGSTKETDRKSGISYYNFTITGKVRY